MFRATQDDALTYTRTMQNLPRRTFERTDAWREGTWLDLWSVVHLLTGVLLGLGFAFFALPTLPAFIIALLALVMYEMWEALAKIHETPQNRTMDVVVGMTSFTPSFLYLAPALTRGELALVFAGVLFINGTLSTLGWRASRKAAELQSRVRARYILERARLARQSARLRKRLRERNQELS